MSFWRDGNGVEVDLIVEKGPRPMRAFEIKASRTFNSRYFDVLDRIATAELGMQAGDYAVVYGGVETVETLRGRMLSLGDVSAELSKAGL